MPLRGGGIRRLMENAILNFHFDYLITSLSLYQVEQIKHQLAIYLRAVVSYKRCSPFGLLQKKMLDRFFIEVGFLLSFAKHTSERVMCCQRNDKSVELAKRPQHSSPTSRTLWMYLKSHQRTE